MEELNEEFLNQIKEEYQIYVNWYKKNFYDIDYMNLDQWYKENEDIYNNAIKCNNCGKYVSEDYGKRMPIDGFICEQCLNDGYGQ